MNKKRDKTRAEIEAINKAQDIRAKAIRAKAIRAKAIRALQAELADMKSDYEESRKTVNERGMSINILTTQLAEAKENEDFWKRTRSMDLQAANDYIGKLHTQLKAMREVVKFYADKNNWADRWVEYSDDNCGDVFDVIDLSDVDIEKCDEEQGGTYLTYGGKRARKLLEETAGTI